MSENKIQPKFKVFITDYVIGLVFTIWLPIILSKCTPYTQVFIWGILGTLIWLGLKFTWKATEPN